MLETAQPRERLYLNDATVKPQTVAHHIERYKLAIASIKAHRGSRALDLACGSGYGTNMLRHAGFDATGVDNSLEAIAFARAHYPETTYRQADITRLLEYPSDRFHLITFFEGIEHLTYEEGQRVLETSRRLLHPQGLFLLSTPRDIDHKHNGFHKSEWKYRQLLQTLDSVYPDVVMFGQDWDTGDFSQREVEHNDFYIAFCQK